MGHSNGGWRLSLNGVQKTPFSLASWHTPTVHLKVLTYSQVLSETRSMHLLIIKTNWNVFNFLEKAVWAALNSSTSNVPHLRYGFKPLWGALFKMSNLGKRPHSRWWTYPKSRQSEGMVVKALLILKPLYVTVCRCFASFGQIPDLWL